MEIKTLKQAVERLAFTIKNQNKANATDKDAFNKVVEFLNEVHTKTINENQLFVKLYAMVLTEFTKYYSDIEEANKQLNKELEKPLNIHLWELQQVAQSFFILDFFKDKGVQRNFSAEISENNLLGDAEVLQKFKNEYQANKDVYSKIDFNEFLETAEFWSGDNIKNHLQSNINLSFHKYKNLN